MFFHEYLLNLSERYNIKPLKDLLMKLATKRPMEQNRISQRCECCVTRIDKISNEYIRGNIKIAKVTEKFRSNTLPRYGHVMGGMIGVEEEGKVNCLRNDMRIKESSEIKQLVEESGRGGIKSK